MHIFEQLGVNTVVNAVGPATRLGGPRMLPEVVDAMAEAASSCVAIDALQAAASARIADATGCEAGFVTAGSAAGLTMATAACLARLDPGRMESLPDTSGMPNEVIICRDQRSGYDHAVRAAGAMLVEVGMNEVVSGAGSRRTEAWEISQAIGERTAAIVYFATPWSEPALEDVIEVSARHNVPLIVDAAGQLPPASNLYRYGSSGADAVVFSGGKAIRGPQGTGVLAGRRELIMSVALQCLDLDEHPDTWDPPELLINRSAIAGMPRHGIGRGFKVSKEEIVGLLVALEQFRSNDLEGEHAMHTARLGRVHAAVQGLTGVHPHRVEPDEDQGYPLLEIRLDPGGPAGSAVNVAQRLRHQSPPIYIAEHKLWEDVIVIHPVALSDEDVDMLIDGLLQLLSI